MPDLEPAKIKLIMELRRQGVTSPAVLMAIERTPRELFLPETMRDRAYENTALPIGQGQTISQPYIVGFMSQELKLNKRLVVLEIGTGSGYQAAVLARLCRRVYTIERHRSLLQSAEAIFRELGLHTISTRLGDGYKGWPEQAPFQRIIVTAAATEPPPLLLEQLAIGGFMLIPIGPTWDTQNIVRITRRESGYDTQELLPVRFVPMVPGIAVAGLPSRPE
ncbi:MAG TPA: protein-L-isoaspartate(D-aspartate) O-methyltransferase [Alphaproteobacteria bacterium]|nr:protein-L-isoaspartate(D-aspartate) O-methyltransferase [Alphaproteobacteria bacterium]